MIKREKYMKTLRGFIDKPLIKVITGIRRSGKSMLRKSSFKITCASAECRAFIK